MKQPKKQTKKPWVPKIKVRVNKDLDKYEGMVLFPEKHEEANRTLKKIKFPLPGE